MTSEMLQRSRELAMLLRREADLERELEAVRGQVTGLGEVIIAEWNARRGQADDRSVE